MQDLIERIEGFDSPRVVLAGDFMLDRYVYGDVERISPEAPVPVLRVIRTDSRPGGAGNVAAAILALGGKAACVGIRGDDAPGEELSNLLAMSGCETAAIVRLAGRSTTIKTRYVGRAQHRNDQQILRVDHDPADAIPERVQVSLVAAVRGEIRRAGALAIQDHRKGVITESTAPEMIAEAEKAGVPALVDPAPVRDYRRYRGATVLLPNAYEAALASGIEITDEASLEQAARRLLDAAQGQAVIVTLGQEGMFLATADGAARRFATRPRAVYDGTGAGDEVLAMLGVSLAAKV